MEEEIRKDLEREKIHCAKCGLIIPLTFKKGPEYTCPSFTFIGGTPICYRDYRPSDYVLKKS